MRWDWRAWRDRLLHLWRGSLRTRTIVITVLLSALAVTVIGVIISTSVRTNLFDSRRDQVLAEASRAAEQAQRTFTNAAELGDAGDVQATAD
nr:sensor histidine kinase [Actinomycetota bacterium]